MRIYLLQQITWGNGLYSDFGLPLHIGYYQTEARAEAVRDARITTHATNGDRADQTTPLDYTITPLDVN